MASGYKVTLDAFEGPLDLLLSLIEKRKMHISDVSLGKITDDYLAYLEEAEGVHIRHTAEFIVVASTLVLIKSRSLLPSLPLEEEEEGSIEDLERQLQEYKQYRDLSKHIKESFGEQIIFRRETQKNITPVFSPTNELTKENLFSAIERVIQSLPKVEHVPQVSLQKMISLREMIDSLAERITKTLKVRFSEFREEQPEKINVVVSFLAMLELIKRGTITAQQEDDFGDIHMESTDTHTPRYY